MKTSNKRTPHPREENDDEGYLNPNDLEIIDDETWEPSDEEILSYAIKLGFDIENDPDELFEIAYSFLKYPLPQGWKRAWYKANKELMYINMEDGEIELATEIEEMAHQTYIQQKQEMIQWQLKKSKEMEPISKVVPRTKIPPLNPLAKSNQSVNSNNSNQLAPIVNHKPEQKEFGVGTSTKHKDESSNVSFLNNTINKSNSDSDITFTDNSEIDSNHAHVQPSGLGKSPLNDISNHQGKQTKQTISIATDSKTTGGKNCNIELDKKQYFNQKLMEWKEYETVLREKYSELNWEYQERKEQIKNQFEDDYSNKTQIQIEEIQSQFKDKLKWYEEQLNNNNQTELEKYSTSANEDYQDNIININKEQDKKSKSEISKLEDELSNIKLKIKCTREQVASCREAAKNEKISFEKNRQILQEKYEIQKRNILKWHELNVKQLERDSNTNYSKYEETLKNKSIQITSSTILQSNHPTNTLLQSKLFENYQKVVDEDYEINCKAIQQDFNMNKEKDLNNFRKSMTIDKEGKLKQMSRDVSELEKEYFTSLFNIRESSKNTAIFNEEQLKHNFEQSLTEYEKLKNKIIFEGEAYLTQWVSTIKENIITELDSTKLEWMVEECIWNMFDEQRWKSQRVKNIFDWNEREISYKQCFMNYWIDLTSYVNKTWIDRQQHGNTPRNTIDDIIESIIKYAKDKIEEYKKAFNNNTDSVYAFQFWNNPNNLWLSNSSSCLTERIGTFKLSTKFGNNYKERKPGQVPSERYINDNNNNNNNNMNSQLLANKDQNNEIDEPEKEIKDNDMKCYTVNNATYLSVPWLSDYALHFLDNEELGLYSNIIVFLKNEYTKIDHINTNVNTKLNVLIWDKIKSYTEETFSFIQDNINKRCNRKFFKEKMNVLLGNISDYKRNFSLDIAYDYELSNNFNKKIIIILTLKAVSPKMSTSMIIWTSLPNRRRSGKTRKRISAPILTIPTKLRITTTISTLQKTAVHSVTIAQVVK